MPDLNPPMAERKRPACSICARPFEDGYCPPADSGPARHWHCQPLTLRDQFAMAAATGLVAAGVNNAAALAEGAYKAADAMLAARGKP